MFKARQMMLDNELRHLVVTNSGKQIGIVTSKEIFGK
jgi:signal-transduction protein with cAMP-binding, CBS, and nucleotidyltransferase domain